MKRSVSILILIGVLVLGLTGMSSAFNLNRDVNVISREAGSGTRGAFIELVGVQERLPNGYKTDRTTIEAMIANKTDVVMASVASNPYAIGYISLGSLNERVKALSIDGIEPTQENIANGLYKIARPFNIATKEEPTGVIKDFIDFILSIEGQAIVADNYIPVIDGDLFVSDGSRGKAVVVGSSSVSPVMEKLAEAYVVFNPNADIEIQSSDSTAGMVGTIEGTADIGMASRELTAQELDQLHPVVIARDGIVVIVNNDNPIDNLTYGQLKGIYIGKETKWKL